MNVLLFSASLVFTILLLCMAATGIKKGKIYYEPSCPPIVFKNRPIAFVLLLLFYVGLGVIFASAALHLFRMI